jgi:SpoVK/Ycf46/Vps4 family AAA+-type ATPase
VACQNITNGGNGSLVLVDEADNLLNTQDSWFMRGETQDKGWLNELLEKPGIRMIWITNSIDGIEGSVLRRFAYSLHFKPFNRRQRLHLWDNILRKNKCKGLFNQKDIETFAKKYAVNAGIIDLAVKKSLESNQGSKAEFRQAVDLALTAHEILLNDGEKKINKDRVEKQFSLEGLNVRGDLKGILEQLKMFDDYLRKENQDKVMNMNLLFYGPPGTGKSELARYIANRLDREIICKRISDLQSKWVGEGEKNIKQAFLEAEQEEAILIIDEADSLLFSRDRAQRSWEISFTNEFLTQMERFRGILICTTNRMNDLDQASIRRFNHKIGFDYLTAAGNQIFYDLFIKSLVNARLKNSTQEEIARIKNLTPGDFKVVRDRYSFYGSKEIDHKIIIDALKEEAEIKAHHHLDKKIGY